MNINKTLKEQKEAEVDREKKLKYLLAEHPNQQIKSFIIMAALAVIWYINSPQLALILAAFLWMIRLDSRSSYLRKESLYFYGGVIAMLLFAAYFIST